MMENGPNSDPNSLPAELFILIGGLLPAYALAEQTPLAVSRGWYTAFKRKDCAFKPCKAKLIADATRSAEDIENLLKNETLLEYLSYEELLIIASFHPTILDKIINMLEVRDLLALGRVNPAVAMRIFNTPGESDKFINHQALNKLSLFSMYACHAEVAYLALSSNNEFDEALLYDLGSVHLSIADLVYEKLRGEWDTQPQVLYYLVKLGSRHPDIARRMMRDHVLRSELSATHIADLCVGNMTLTRELMNKDEFSDLFSKYNEMDLIRLCRNNFTRCKMILTRYQTPQIIRTYIGSSFKNKGIFFREMILKVKDNPEYLTNIDKSLKSLIQTFILEKLDLINDTSVTSEQLLVEFHKFDFFKNLDENCLTVLINLASKNEELAECLLNRSHCRDALLSRGLVELSHCSFKIAKRIVDEFSDALSDYDLSLMCTRLDITQYIFSKRPDLFQKLKSERLEALCEKFIWVAMKYKELTLPNKPVQAVGFCHQAFSRLDYLKEILSAIETVKPKTTPKV